MKTTVDIPEPLYRQARIRAAESGQTLREVFVRALQNELYPRTSGSSLRDDQSSSLEAHFRVDELGVPVLRRAPNDPTTVTNDLVNELREREGI